MGVEERRQVRWVAQEICAMCTCKRMPGHIHV